jgi:glucose-1-phosphate thymidylyltransferase
MKGIILAGGTGSRLFPLSRVTNKHLLPVGRKPMIYYPIEKLRKAGIAKIMIVTGVEHMGNIVSLLGGGKEFDCSFTYCVQEEAGGIAQALSLAEDFVHGDQMTVILGDNIFEDEIGPTVGRFEAQKEGARLLLKEVPDPERFGVANVKDGKVLGIEEKPKKPKSNYAVTGIYFYDGQVFDIIRTLKPSGRAEFEITDVNNAYLKAGKLECDFLEGWWTDAGTFPSLALANHLVEGQDNG